MGRLYFLFFLLSSSIVLAQTQDSLVLQPGPLDGKDAIVWSITPDSTWGWNQEATMTAWTYQGDPSYKRFYIEFDYSNIPAGAIIDSAFIFYNNNPSAPSHSGLHSGSNTFGCAVSLPHGMKIPLLGTTRHLPPQLTKCRWELQVRTRWTIRLM